jgi:hypothetical protein
MSISYDVGAEHHMETNAMADDASARPDATQQRADTEQSKSPDPAKPQRRERLHEEQLPTDRIAFDKQLKLLLAYAAASEGGRNPVSNDEVGKIVEMNSSTVSLANPFFVKLGFLQRSGRGYLPVREVIEYANASSWAADEAGQKLSSILEKSWFWLAVKPKLHLRTISEDEAIADMALKAAVGPESRPQLKMLLNYLLTGGLVRREGDKLAMQRRGPEAGPEPPRSESPQPRPPSRSPEHDLSHLHPFFQGLLVTLPREGDEWTAAERAKWLQLAESVFRVIYKGGGVVNVTVDEE